MNTTPATTVHAAPVPTRQQRRRGVGRATAVTVAVLLLMGLLPRPDAAAATPNGPPADPAASQKLPPGREKKQEPTATVAPTSVPVPTPVPTRAPTPAPASSPQISPPPASTDPRPSDAGQTLAPAAPRPAATPRSPGSNGSVPPIPTQAVPSNKPSATPGLDAAGVAEDRAGPGAAPDEPGSGSGGGPTALVVALGGGTLVAIIAGLLIAATRRRAEDAGTIVAAATLDPEPIPEADPEQRLAEALAANRRGARAAVAGGSVPLWVQRLGPEPPPLPTPAPYPVSDEPG